MHSKEFMANAIQRQFSQALWQAPPATGDPVVVNDRRASPAICDLPAASRK